MKALSPSSADRNKSNTCPALAIDRKNKANRPRLGPVLGKPAISKT